MRWLPLLLVTLSYFAPIEKLVSTLEGELIIRSTWSVMLVFACYFCLSAKRLAVVLCCEFWSIAYNFTIALGYFFTDKDLGAWYAGMMIILFCIELAATFPGVKRDIKRSGDNRHRYSRRSFGNYDLFASAPVQVDSCKI